MKTQTRPAIAITLLVVGCAVVALLWRSHPGVDLSPANDANISNKVSIQWPEQEPTSATKSGRSEAGVKNASPSPKPTQAVGDGFPSVLPGEDPLKKMLDQAKAEYIARNVRPIYFYGLVVDEAQAPIDSADIYFSQIGESQTSPMKTDPTGRFQLSGVSGRYVRVDVSKQGYYLTKTSRQSFDYSPEGGNFQPDISNPIGFHLRAKGPGANLTTSQHGFTPHFEFRPPVDGSPIMMDFFNRKAGDSGEMEVRKLSPIYDPNNYAAKEWRLTLSIPDGGFAELKDAEFPFYPPESGYQPLLDFHFQPAQPGWTNGFDRQYYIAFGNPRRYGRIKLDTSVTGGIRLEYAVNPDGSRYLEPKEKE